ncbi:MAG TPA: hypothetical protein VM432_06665 [Bdellovibrionales bacterium]|nr:hypothetical protein [Bdellovibrionales bacterium]
MTDNQWLVKSGDQILGPFSTAEVVRRIRIKELVVIDEIAPPRSRWRYIRDIPAFASVVEEIRRGLSQGREDTEIQGYTTTDTQAISERKSDVTPITVSDSRMPIDMSRVRDADFEETPDEKTYPDLVSPLKKYGLDKQSAQAGPRVRVGPALITGILVLVLSVGFIVWTATQRQPSKTGAVDSSKLAGLAASAWNKGDFETSLAHYEKIEREKPGQPEVAVRLAPLLMQLRGSNVEAKRLLEKASESAPIGSVGRDLIVANGLVALFEEDYSGAVSILESSDSSAGHFNRGVAFALNDAITLAIDQFKQAGRDPAVKFMILRAVSMGSPKERSSLRDEAQKALRSLVTDSGDFKQEGYVVGAYLDLDAGDQKSALTKVNEAIKIDPEMTRDHVHDPLLYLNLGSWTSLMPLCRTLDERLKTTATSALFAMCLAKSNLLPEGLKRLDEEIGRHPQDQMLQAMNAYLLSMAGREDAAKASIKVADQSGPMPLGEMVAARICVRERNFDCAEESWARLASSEPPPLAALTGLAQARFAKGDRDGAGALLVKVESLSPRYIPLLRLREETASQ